jgi:hypothetical protein
MRGRRVAAPEEEEPLHVSLARALRPSDAAALCCATAHTLLFLRAQLPGLYADIRAQALGGDGGGGGTGGSAAADQGTLAQRRRRPATGDRRVRKLVDAVDALGALLTPELFTTVDVEVRRCGSAARLLHVTRKRKRNARAARATGVRGAAPAARPHAHAPRGRLLCCCSARPRRGRGRRTCCALTSTRRRQSLLQRTRRSRRPRALPAWTRRDASRARWCTHYPPRRRRPAVRLERAALAFSLVCACSTPQPDAPHPRTHGFAPRQA